eukprot:4289766-Pleurochrysis_carterae.AAC.1
MLVVLPAPFLQLSSMHLLSLSLPLLPRPTPLQMLPCQGVVSKITNRGLRVAQQALGLIRFILQWMMKMALTTTASA